MPCIVAQNWGVADDEFNGEFSDLYLLSRKQFKRERVYLELFLLSGFQVDIQ